MKQEKPAIDWREKQRAKAGVKVTIGDFLDKLPEKYTPEIYDQKTQLVYQHVYESYFGQGMSVYGSR